MITLEHGDLLGWRNRVGAALAAQGDRLVVFGGARVAVVHDATGAELARLDHLEGVLDVAFSPDGARIATASGDMGVRVFGDGVELHKGHLHDVTAVAWAPGGALASASLDGTVRVWDRWTARGLGARPRRLCWLDDRRLVVATDHGLVMLDDAGARIAAAPIGATRGLVAAGDAVLAIAQHEVVAWDGEIRWRRTAQVAAARGGEVVVADDTHVIEVDPATGADRRVLGTHDAAVTALAFVGDDVVSGSADTTLRVWGARPGAIDCGQVVSTVLAAGGAVVVVTQDGVVRWGRLDALGPARATTPPRAATWRQTHAASASLAVAPDAARLAIASGEEAVIRDARTGEIDTRLAAGGSLARVGAWTRDALFGHLQDGAVRVWHGETLAPRGTAGKTASDVLVVGRWAVTHGYAHASIYDLAEPTPRLVAVRRMDYRRNVSSDGRTLLIGGLADGAAELFALDADARSLGWIGGGPRGGLTLPTEDPSSDDAIRLPPLDEPAPDLPIVARGEWSPGGARLATAGLRGGLALWRDRELIASVACAQVFTIRWSPRGDRVALHDSDDTVVVLDAEGRELHRRGCTGTNVVSGYSGPTWSPDGARLAIGNKAGFAVIVDAVTGAEVARLAGHASQYLDAYAVGDLVLTRANVSPARDLVARLWTWDGAPVASLGGHRGEAWWKVEVSPDGRWLCTVTRGDPTPRLWSLPSGRLAGTLPGHDGLVRDVAFAGGALFTLDEAGLLQRWEI